MLYLFGKSSLSKILIVFIVKHIFLFSSWFCVSCCLFTGDRDGAGAPDGPSAQHVQAGTEWSWSQSRETLEILRF